MNWNESLKWEFTYVKLMWELNNCSSFDAFKPKLISGGITNLSLLSRFLYYSNCFYWIILGW